MSRAEPASAFAPLFPIEPIRESPAARFGKKLRAAWQAWINRRSVMPLLEFDERMLRDIGLTRSDVTSALASPAGEDPSLRLARASRERRDARRSALRERAFVASHAWRQQGQFDASSAR